MQRSNLKVVPSEREYCTRIAVADDRLAFPKAAAATLRNIRSQTLPALATDQPQRTRLIFGQLMHEADGLGRGWCGIVNGVHIEQSF